MRENGFMPAFTPPKADLLARLSTCPTLQVPYPPIETFKELEFQAEDLEKHLRASQSFAIHLHIPFCKELCNYCNCNIVVTRQYGLAAQYADYLKQEIQWYGQIIKGMSQKRLPPKQIYFGGGTPTFLLADDLRRVTYEIENSFGVSHAVDRDYCIETDPRTVDTELVSLVKSLGFNRIHFGVEDFSTQVQQVINRKYTFEKLKQSTSDVRSQGIQSVSFDVTFGLPQQSLGSFMSSLKQLLKLSPSRVVLRKYHHNPKIFTSQSLIDIESVPEDKTVMEMRTFAINHLQSSGYCAIGPDCFVSNDDPLCDATKSGRLQWTQHGYVPDVADTVIGFGLSAISSTPSAVWQNQLGLRDYTRQVRSYGHSVYRGTELSVDDQIRKEITQRLLCNLEVNKEEFESRWKTSFDHYFAKELSNLEQEFGQQMVISNQQKLRLTPSGQWFANQLASYFRRAG
ncbi:radical SAM protein [Sessilibacter sp. MAH4]